MSDNIDKKMAMAIGAASAVAMGAIALGYFLKSGAKTIVPSPYPDLTPIEESKEESKSA